MDLAARDAIAAQPTGYTLETTQVKLKVGQAQELLHHASGCICTCITAVLDVACTVVCLKCITVASTVDCSMPRIDTTDLPCDILLV